MSPLSADSATRSRARDLLGKTAGEAEIEQLQQDSSLQHKVVADKERKTVRVQAANEQFSAEEIVVCLL